jgi:hypothetical protein
LAAATGAGGCSRRRIRQEHGQSCTVGYEPDLSVRCFDWHSATQSGGGIVHTTPLFHNRDSGYDSGTREPGPNGTSAPGKADFQIGRDCRNEARRNICAAKKVQRIAADIRQRIYKGDFASLARSRRSSFIFAVQRSVRFLAPTNAFASSPLVDHLPSRSKGEYGPHVQTPQREFEFAAGTRGRVSQRPLNSIAGEAVKTSAACPERTHSRFRA